MTRGPRDHGYGDAPTVAGAPIVGDRLLGVRCPNCGSVTVFKIEAEIVDPSPMLRRPEAPHRVIGRYVGCPACPWASPMMTSCELLPQEKKP